MLKSKFLIVFITSLIWINIGLCQVGNEWINYNQEYYKLTINQEGVYQITYNELIDANLPLSTIDARTFQLFHRGNEISINISGQSDGRIDQGDFIEFIAKANDGESDTPLYDDPTSQPHTYYNLFTDETAYFLTWKLDGSFGKRMQRIGAINNSGGLTVESSIIKQIRNVFVNVGIRGQPEQPQNEVFKSDFNLGEGWTGQFFTGQKVLTVNNIDQQVRSSENLNLELLIQGRNNLAHEIEVKIGPNVGTLRTISNVSIEDYQYVKISSPISWADVNVNGELTVVINCPATRVSVSYISIDYNRSFNVSNTPNSQYQILPNSQGSSFVAFTNTNSGAKLYGVNTFNDPVILETSRVGNTISTVINNTENGKNLYLKNQAFLIPELKKVQFRDFSTIDPDYVVISNRLLNQSIGEYNAVVRDYASYRASAVGGNYDTLVAYVDQLFDQFNYGEVSPLAIFRFSKYLVENTKAKYVFIIGKGNNWYQRPYRAPIFNDYYDEYVPSAGSPGSDNLFGYGQINPNELSLAFGRLNAHNPQVVADYLNKIKEMESQPLNDLRRKAFLHLSGGISESEISSFNSYINDFSTFARAPYIGGTAENITKETTQVVELINVSEQVNAGLNMITFFGHSGTNTSDIDIGFVSDPAFGYQNSGKYPLIYVNGCNAGSIYEREIGSTTFGENWVNTPNLGATHVLAHTAEGFPNELKRYSDIFYRNAYGDSSLIDQPIGEIHVKTSNQYLGLFGNNPLPLFVSQALQFNLMGDPAYKLFPTNQPDFELTDVDIDLVSLDGQNIDALTSNFAFDIILKNYGITTSDSLPITVNRILSSGESIPLDTQYYASPYNLDTLRYFVENNRLGEFGESTFEIIVDPNNVIDEFDEGNNIAYFEYFFSIGTTINLYPYNSSIVSTREVNLVTQSVDLLSEEREFLFQLDTSNTFDSPFLKSGTATGKVIARQSFNLLDKEGSNYYWRSKFAEVRAGELDEWTVSQFVYNVNNSKGWIQNNYEEYIRNEFVGLEISPNSWQYIARDIPIEVITPANTGTQQLVISILNEDYAASALPEFEGCKLNSVNLVAFDQTNGIPYRILKNGAPDINDPLSCGKRPQVINQILNANLNDPTTYFQKYYDELPEGDFVLITSYDSVAWPILIANNRDELLDLGATASTLNVLGNGNPYILLGRKGAGAGNGVESFSLDNAPPAGSDQLIVSLDNAINIRFNSGSVNSNIIGPVKAWQQVDANFTDFNSQDDIRLDIFGIDTLNNQTLLFSDVVLPKDISAVNASEFPFLRLRVILTDSTEFTPPRLINWNVTFDELPDLVMLLNQEKPKNTFQLAEGDSLELSYEMVNVTPNNFQDSVLLSNRIYNQQERSFKIVQDKLPPLGGNERYAFKQRLSTKGQVGVNDLYIALNSEKQYNEFRKINNQIGLRNLLDVKKDSIPPFIEVTFDGISILDGDIVSPSPLIQIAIKDENNFLPVSDTTALSLSLEGSCDNCVSEKLFFSDPKISYQRSTEDNSFIITYKPDSFDDGLYKLGVNARDASNNEAGAEPYEVNFEVINASTITKFFPYPNPFSTQTRFVFTLTGAEIPDEIKIQILTVSGRVVREILQDEIGLIHIGNNITDYAWDGRDEFGDRLANGVYLYRVLVRKNGVFMDQRETSADKAFKKGYGKMYILR